MFKMQQKTKIAAKAPLWQQTAGRERENPELEVLQIPQQIPLVRQVSRLANRPNTDAHTSILNRTLASPHATRQRVLQLQRYYGNRYVNQVLQHQARQSSTTSAIPTQAPIQAKMTVGPAEDRYEREADWMAKQMMSRMHAAESSQRTQSVQRLGMPKEENELMMKPTIQRQWSEDGGDIAPELEMSIQ